MSNDRRDTFLAGYVFNRMDGADMVSVGGDVEAWPALDLIERIIGWVREGEGMWQE